MALLGPVMATCRSGVLDQGEAFCPLPPDSARWKLVGAMEYIREAQCLFSEGGGVTSIQS